MSAVVMTTSIGSPANAWQATSASRRSSWNSVEQVTSTSGRSMSSSQAGASAGGSQSPGPTRCTFGRPVRARVLERLGRVGEHGVGGEVDASMVRNGGTPSSARRPLTSRATMRSSVPSVSVRAHGRAVGRSGRGAAVARGRTGGASREVQRDGRHEENAHGSPDRSAAAAAPHEPSSMNSASGCSVSMALRRGLGSLVAGALAELAAGRT